MADGWASGGADGAAGGAREVAGCRLERLLGAGAMGEVHLARRLADGRPVVVKVLAPSGLDPGKLRARFAREGEVLCRLPPHPHVVRGLAAALDGPRPALVLELVEGESLLGRLRLGPLPPDEAAAVGRDAARGLAHLHAHGIVHRDVKPDNLMITAAGQVKVVDLGIVRDAYATALTAPEELLGTGPYIPPERWRGDEDAGAAGDVWSLGATLFHLVAGRPPFVAPSLEALAAAALAGPAPRLAEVVPGVPAGLDEVVARMLAPDPGDRHPSAAACADDLERVLHGEPPGAPALALADGRRLSLEGARRLVLGAGPGCEVPLAGEGVAAQHAQLRRVAGGWELRDLRAPAGTAVDGRRVAGAVRLTGACEVALGAARLRFEPAEACPLPLVLRDAPRVVAPAPVVEALARAGDPRAAAARLEALAPDPVEREEVRALAFALGGEPCALAALAAWAQGAAARARAAVAWLAGVGLAGAAGGEAGGLLAAWDARRRDAPPQVGRAPRPLVLAVVQGGGAGLTAPLGAATVLLVGREARCHLRLADRTVSRHHATLLRLHGRWLARDEGRALPAKLDGRPIAGPEGARLAWLDPGARLDLGDAALLARLEPFEGPPGGTAAPGGVAYAAFEALAASGHPAARPGLERLARQEAPTAASRAVVEGLAAADPGRADALAAALATVFRERAAAARAALARTPAGWAGPAPLPGDWLDPA